MGEKGDEDFNVIDMGSDVVEQLLQFMGLNPEEVKKDKGLALKQKLESVNTGSYKAKPNKLIKKETQSNNYLMDNYLT